MTPSKVFAISLLSTKQNKRLQKREDGEKLIVNEKIERK
jgi:hypothetical protein